MTKREQIEEIKDGAETAKMRLIKVEDELREIGAIREANSLATIITKLEMWQNR